MSFWVGPWKYCKLCAAIKHLCCYWQVGSQSQCSTTEVRKRCEQTARIIKWIKRCIHSGLRYNLFQSSEIDWGHSKRLNSVDRWRTLDLYPTTMPVLHEVEEEENAFSSSCTTMRSWQFIFYSSACLLLSSTFSRNCRCPTIAIKSIARKQSWLGMPNIFVSSGTVFVLCRDCW